MKKPLTLSQKRTLFDRIAIESGVESLDTVKRVYYGMVRLMGRELKERGLVVLPDWGRFRVHEQAERRYGDLRTKEVKIAAACKVVKYVPDQKLKNYVKNLE